MRYGAVQLVLFDVSSSPPPTSAEAAVGHRIAKTQQAVFECRRIFIDTLLPFGFILPAEKLRIVSTETVVHGGNARYGVGDVVMGPRTMINLTCATRTAFQADQLADQLGMVEQINTSAVQECEK